MLKPRAILIDENPEAIVQTSRGWRYPDGTVKPFDRQRVAGPIEPVAQPSIWQRVKALAKG